ncbi:MarR family transcriptional regulator [Halolamina sp. CBA1230]|uniref:MarR family transcriptional regulator n=1 Tax=Halolamina sp. CBA1230 TaxID=1853690 RepID=UPI0009A21B1C|nr:helix-turn-helix domain-containing protein [Halolamina sp. CBA1230]QKY20218.1 MarR family transcriptional regulator [Halolamina sp. CBA1230]
MSGGSIDITEFESGESDEFGGGNPTERIVEFLASHDDRAWKAATIAERTGIDAETVSSLLSRLKERELVRHKSPYWAITDDEERLAEARRTHEATVRYDEQFGEEDESEWETEDSEVLE